MRFNFAETFRRLRKENGLTQEKLSEILDVSSQSVSRWELGNSYPDIELLPTIANCFGVTVDYLLSNDVRSKEEDQRIYRETLPTLSTKTTEKIDFIKEYCLKYPNEDMYAYHLICAIREYAIGDDEKTKRVMPLLRRNVDKLLETNLANLAIMVMAEMCEEKELDDWLNRVPRRNFGRRDLLLSRVMMHKDWERHNIHRALSLFERLEKGLREHMADSLDTRKKEALGREKLAAIAALGGGESPAAWGAFCAYQHFVLSATLFEQGNEKEGWQAFDAAEREWQTYFTAKEEFLPLGGELFANMKVNRAWTQAVDQNGERYELFCGTVLCRPDSALNLLTNPRWSWFDTVRNTEKYKETVKAMQKIALGE